MEEFNLLLRYLHLGRIEPHYIESKKPLVTENAEERLAFLKSEGMEDNWAFEAIKKALTGKSLVRRDEAIFALAFCCRHLINEKVREHIYKNLPDVLVSCSDLFLFVKFYHDFGRGRGFGRGLKNAIKIWYERKTPLELADMIGARRYHYKWSHKDLIHLAHVHFTDVDKQKILNSTFVRGIKVLQKETPEEEQTEGSKRLRDIFRLKVCELPRDAVDMITLNKFTIEQCPAHLLHNAEVWEAALPTISYEDLLKYLPTLNHFKLLKPNASLSQKYAFALANPNAISESEVYPIKIFSVLRSYEQQSRYSEYVRKHHYEKKVSNQKLLPNAKIVQSLKKALNLSYHSFPKSGLRYFITLDVKRKNFIKTILGERHLSCMEVGIIYALSTLKRENEVTIMTYTKQPGVLKRLNFHKDMTYEDALAECQKVQVEKTSCHLFSPVEYALTETNKYDVFVTMVSSIASFNQVSVTPYDLLRTYKQYAKLRYSKYAAVNLCRAKQDIIQHSVHKGVLEINGFTASTPKIISCYAKNQFL